MHDILVATLMFAQDAPDSAYLVWGVVLFGAAVFFVALELILPSAGMLALLSAGSVIASIVAFFLHSPTAGLVAVLSYLVLVPAALTFGLKWWMNSPLGRRLVLSSSVEGTRDADEASDGDRPLADGVAGRRPGASLRELIGAEGVTVTPLRPVGTVRIEGRRVDALSESGTIDADTPIVVTDVYDNQVKVKARV